jgi:hypothetical protein
MSKNNKSTQQTIYGTRIKTLSIGARVNIVYLARFINLVERKFGITVQSTSAAIRAVMESLVDKAEGEYDVIDRNLREGGIIFAQQYLVAKGLMSAGSISQGDRSTAKNITREYEKLELSGEGETGIGTDFSILAQLPGREEGVRALAGVSPAMIQARADELYQSTIGNEGMKGEPDALNEPLIDYKGIELERMEKKVRSWARNPEFAGYDGLSKQEKIWFDDEGMKVLEEKL